MKLKVAIDRMVNKKGKKYNRLLDDKMEESQRREVEKYGDKCRAQIEEGYHYYVRSKKQGLQQIDECNSYTSSNEKEDIDYYEGNIRD